MVLKRIKFFDPPIYTKDIKSQDKKKRHQLISDVQDQTQN